MGGCSSKPKTTEFEEGAIELQEDKLQDEAARKSSEADNLGRDAGLKGINESLERDRIIQTLFAEEHGDLREVLVETERQKLLSINPDDILKKEDRAFEVRCDRVSTQEVEANILVAAALLSNEGGTLKPSIPALGPQEIVKEPVFIREETSEFQEAPLLTSKTEVETTIFQKEAAVSRDQTLEPQNNPVLSEEQLCELEEPTSQDKQDANGELLTESKYVQSRVIHKDNKGTLEDESGGNGKGKKFGQGSEGSEHLCGILDIGVCKKDSMANGDVIAEERREALLTEVVLDVEVEREVIQEDMKGQSGFITIDVSPIHIVGDVVMTEISPDCVRSSIAIPSVLDVCYTDITTAVSPSCTPNEILPNIIIADINPRNAQALKSDKQPVPMTQITSVPERVVGEEQSKSGSKSVKDEEQTPAKDAVCLNDKLRPDRELFVEPHTKCKASEDQYRVVPEEHVPEIHLTDDVLVKEPNDQALVIASGEGEYIPRRITSTPTEVCEESKHTQFPEDHNDGIQGEVLLISQLDVQLQLVDTKKANGYADDTHSRDIVAQEILAHDMTNANGRADCTDSKDISAREILAPDIDEVLEKLASEFVRQESLARSTS